MDFQVKIRELAKRIESLRNNVQTEEATKHSFVMPFISLLGYDVFNPKTDKNLYNGLSRYVFGK